jgi:RNA polymerase sigma-70 factor (ECF subfamily)
MIETYAERTMQVEPRRHEPDRENLIRDQALVRRMRAGDEPAFEEFADTYTKLLYRFAISRVNGDRELAREVVQATLCKALAKLDGFRGDATLLTWLCAVCRNEILMQFRKRKNAPAESPLEDNVVPIAAWPAGSRDPEDESLERETAGIVHMALDLLPGHYADALEWKYIDRISVREIGERLQVGAKAAESILTRARGAFRKSYGRVVAELDRARSGETRGGGES